MSGPRDSFRLPPGFQPLPPCPSATSATRAPRAARTHTTARRTVSAPRLAWLTASCLVVARRRLAHRCHVRRRIESLQPSNQQSRQTSGPHQDSQRSWPRSFQSPRRGLRSLDPPHRSQRPLKWQPSRADQSQPRLNQHQSLRQPERRPFQYQSQSQRQHRNRRRHQDQRRTQSHWPYHSRRPRRSQPKSNR